MKKSLILLFACVLSLSVFGQKTYDLASFKAISNETSADVNIKLGSTQSLTARGSSSALDRLRLEVERGSLKIKSKKGANNWKSDDKITINITMTDLTALANSGSGDIMLSGDYDMSTFAISNSGSGDLLCKGSINTNQLSISNSGSGDMQLAGRSDRVSIANSGSGDIGMARMSSGEASVVNSGSGDIEIKCNGKLSAVNTGSGDIGVGGSPTKKSIVNTGSGDITYGKGQE